MDTTVYNVDVLVERYIQHEVGHPFIMHHPVVAIYAHINIPMVNCLPHTVPDSKVALYVLYEIEPTCMDAFVAFPELHNELSEFGPAPTHTVRFGPDYIWIVL